MNLTINKLSDLSKNLEKRSVDKGTLIQAYHDTIQIIEVGNESINNVKVGNYDELNGFYICLENVRPELFIRRDFIKDFILKGKVFLIQDKKCPKAKNSDNNYYMIIKNNILSLILTGSQYRRFGLIGKKKCKNKKFDYYEVNIDLKDERIMRSNKYQDKLVLTLRRLEPISKVYLRWCPDNNPLLKTDDITFEYFNHVIEEYKTDGFKPVPLESCFKVEQKFERRWTNRSQLHPPLLMNVFSKEILQLTKDNSNKSKDENKEIFAKVIDIVDWLGYQLLSLDCDQEEISWKYNSLLDNETCEPYNVYCSQISGIYDCDLIEAGLKKLLDSGGQEENDSVIFRALFLYNRNLNDSNNDQVTILLQDYSTTSTSIQSNDKSKCNRDYAGENLTTVLELTCNNT